MDIHKFYNLGLGLTLICLLFSAACSTAMSPSIAVAADGDSVLVSGHNLTSASHDEALAIRWQAMARFYEKQSLQGKPLTSFNPSEVTAYRWQALGDFYTGDNSVSKLLTEFTAEESLAYRWQAIAQFYEKHR